MTIATKFAVVVVCAMIGQPALADSTSQGGKQDTKPASDSCPTGKVKSKDGVCVEQKSGQMGFDLDAPSDNDKSSSSSSSGGTRSTGNSSGH